MKYMMYDFETLTTVPTRVWAWAAVDIIDGDEKTGNSIDSFINYISQWNHRGYFHNLKFDGNFIVYYLLTHNYTHLNKEKLEPLTFKTVIGDMGNWFQISIMFGNGVKVDIVDSLKVIPLPVENIPKAFGLEIQKLSIDYNENREEGHELTNEESKYVLNDVRIVAQALKILIYEGLTKITAPSNAMADIKKRLGKDHKYFYPALELSVDADCRKAYKGGWSFR